MRCWKDAFLILAFIVWGEPAQGQELTADSPPANRLWQAWESHFGRQSYSVKQLSRMIDDLEDDIRDDGVVVVKHPDVWGQSRMTKYRVDFEKGMTDTSTKFETVLSAAVARSDQASFEQQTALGPQH